MNQDFFKYQGTGNDFVMIDNRDLLFDQSNQMLIAQLCHRKLGVGADGLILIEKDDAEDFKMIYFNADGRESSMCGNGGRCAVAFAYHLRMIGKQTRFIAIDGLHMAMIEAGKVSLQMKDVDAIKSTTEYIYLDTGSPHHIVMTPNLANYDVFSNGRAIAHGDLYGQAGSNVNFVEQLSQDSFAIRTYERGVEGETLSCGTGATAVAIAMHHRELTASHKINIKVMGGSLQISFDTEDKKSYTKIFLKGATQQVYRGQYKC